MTFVTLGLRSVTIRHRSPLSLTRDRTGENLEGGVPAAGRAGRCIGRLSVAIGTRWQGFLKSGRGFPMTLPNQRT
jgi:hypothetical protein